MTRAWTFAHWGIGPLDQIVASAEAHEQNQLFQFQPTDGGFYRIVARHSNRCLDVYGQSLNLKALIQQYDCWGGSNQQFRFQPSDSGYYRLVARGSTMCLDVITRSTGDGASSSTTVAPVPTNSSGSASGPSAF